MDNDKVTRSPGSFWTQTGRADSPYGPLLRPERSLKLWHLAVCCRLAGVAGLLLQGLRTS